MVSLTYLDARTLERHLREDHLNRYGWMQPESSKGRRKMTLVTAFRAVCARLAPSAWVGKGTGSHGGLDASATESGVRSLA